MFESKEYTFSVNLAKRGAREIIGFLPVLLQTFKDNAHKGWPERTEVLKLLKHLATEVIELTEAIHKTKPYPFTHGERENEIVHECADIIVCAMLIASASGALDSFELN